MKQIIQPSLQYHPLSGVCHYFPDLLTIFRGVAVNVTAFARWLGVEGAERPFSDAVFEQSGALSAEGVFFGMPGAEELGQNRLAAGNPVMSGMTEKLDEAGKNPEVADLFFV